MNGDTPSTPSATVTLSSSPAHRSRRLHAPDTELRGTIERVQFASDRGWCVLKVRTDTNSTVTIRGTAVSAAAGERVVCRGTWIDHPKYGRQFDAQTILTTPPVTPDAIEQYLASGAIEGVGPHYARKLVEHFGIQLPEVLKHNPVYLESVTIKGASIAQGDDGVLASTGINDALNLNLCRITHRECVHTETYNRSPTLRR